MQATHLSKVQRVHIEVRVSICRASDCDAGNFQSRFGLSLGYTTLISARDVIKWSSDLCFQTSQPLSHFSNQLVARVGAVPHGKMTSISLRHRIADLVARAS